MFKKIVWLWFSAKWKNAKDVEKYIQNLVDGWATEFFTGYNPPYWHEKFGFEVSPNGRFSEHEQITDFETLKQIVIEVNKHKVEIFINLKARYYTDDWWISTNLNWLNYLLKYLNFRIFKRNKLFLKNKYFYNNGFIQHRKYKIFSRKL